MLVLSTKPFHKLTGADGQADRRTGKHMCWEAAPPKIHSLNPLNIMEHVYYGHCCTSPRFREPSWAFMDPQLDPKIDPARLIFGTLADKSPSKVQID